MADPKEETSVCRRHIDSIVRHIDTMAGALKQERERRKQIQPAAVAYQTLRKRILEVIRQSEEGCYISAFELKAALKGLPKTLDG